MTDFQKKILLEVIEGKEHLAHLAFHISRTKRCNDICLWLIKNKITGVKLAQFWRFDCDRSYLELIKKVISKIDKDELRPIIGGRDYT